MSNYTDPITEGMRPALKFQDLEVGDHFEFLFKSYVGCGKYNGVFRKTDAGSYGGQCFTGYPSLDALVKRISTDKGEKCAECGKDSWTCEHFKDECLICREDVSNCRCER